MQHQTMFKEDRRAFSSLLAVPQNHDLWAGVIQQPPPFFLRGAVCVSPRGGRARCETGAWRLMYGGIAIGAVVPQQWLLAGRTFDNI